MALPEAVTHFIKRPGMYVPSVEFNNVVSFLQGYNLAMNGALLGGFTEWLILRLGCTSSLVWYELVLLLAFPGAESPRAQLVAENSQQRVLDFLFGLLETYSEEKASARGIRGIYVKYQQWLQRQEWYGPDSPDWIPDDSDKEDR